MSQASRAETLADRAGRRCARGEVEAACPPDVQARASDVVPRRAAAKLRSAATLVGGLLAYGRIRLALGLMFGIALPAAIHWAVSRFLQVSPLDSASLTTMTGASISLIVGFFALRQIRSFPGVNSAAYVVWVFTAAYGVFLLGLVFGRVAYSRYQLVACFVLTVAWFLVMHYAVIRARPMRLAVIPSAGVGQLPQLRLVAWTRLREPRLPGAVAGVVADLNEDHDLAWRSFLTQCALQGLPIFDVKQVTESLTGRVEIGQLSENTLAYKVHAAAYRKVKRAIDTTAALALSPLILAVIAVAALAVKLESPGPTLFAQARMGFRGRPFRVIKLRTMRHGGEAGDHFTCAQDARITRVGRFLRKYHIDELPQAWNIVRGEMSWIGPRPEAVALAEAYEREAPFYSYRHIVRPGITGWAQVHQGNVAGSDEARVKLQYDFFYLKNLSAWLDAVIAIKTVQTVATGFGAR
jgi:lipopolysaccharide/colanic/teichoic acid biosynthesis glycosyltransferase